MSLKRKTRAVFSGRFGVIAAAAGSAIGLGNIWKFPYITHKYGGGAFVYVYLGFILAIGLPIMLSEIVIGRKSRRNAFGAFKKLAPGKPWKFIGIFGVGAAFLILSFYSVIAGWSLKYIVFSITDSFNSLDSAGISDLFENFHTSPGSPALYHIIFMILTGTIVIMGVHKGIESFSKILMPLLLVLLIVLDIKALTSKDAGNGLIFLFNPDFSKLTYEGILDALGHAFFSLSLGMGTLITYGSYIKKQNNLVRTAVQVTVADTVIAILAAVAIILAVPETDIASHKGGPGLIFIVLPNVFNMPDMIGGYYFSILFFTLLTIAALTSAISILEVVVAFFSEELKMKRNIAVGFAVVLITLLGIICSLSFGIYKDVTFFNLSVFDLLDFIATKVMLPLGGMLIALFIGWGFGRYKVFREIAHGGSLKGWFLRIFMILVKYVAPISIFLILLKMTGLLDLILGCFGFHFE